MLRFLLQQRVQHGRAVLLSMLRGKSLIRHGFIFSALRAAVWVARIRRP